jgi:homogentisate 1,2-dioxygenase
MSGWGGWAAGASRAELKPTRVADGTQAFMFETHFMLSVTTWAAQTCGKVQPDYYRVWQDLRSNFRPGDAPKPATA